MKNTNAITEGYLEGAIEQLELARYDLQEYLRKEMEIDK
mgnify:CR=1 FL=1|tara:strand:- start:323 stop:439 length:117 start_codon:yes stop_codon:yes gene_type:complete